MLVKSFNDDLSWKVQRRLVNSYFNEREQQVTCEEVEKETDAGIDLIEENLRFHLLKDGTGETADGFQEFVREPERT